MYSLTKYMKLSNRVSILASILYMSSASVSFYPIAQAFNSWGAAFLPLLFIPAFKSIIDREKPISIVGLAATVSILLSTHMMTLIIGLMAILPFFVFSFIKSKKKLYWLRQMGLSIGVAMLLSANSIVGFLDPYLSNNILQPFHQNQMSGDVVKFLPVRNDLYNIGLVYIIIFVFSISVIVLNWKKSVIEERFSAVIGGFFLVLASGVLPWDDLPRIIPFLQTFQFPHRFDIVSYVLLIVAFSMVIEKISINKTAEYKTILFSSVIVLCFISVLNINAYISSQSWLWQGDDPTAGGNNKTSMRVKDPELLRKAFKSPKLADGLNAVVKGTPDYLPIPNNSNNELIYSNNPYKEYEEQFIDNPLKYTRTITKSAEIKIEWNSINKDDVQLPVAVYNHSVINLNGKKLNGDKLNKTNLGALVVKPEIGRNTAVISYKSSLSIKFVFGLKLIGIIILIVSLFYNIKNKQIERIKVK